MGNKELVDKILVALITANPLPENIEGIDDTHLKRLSTRAIKMYEIFEEDWKTYNS